MKEKRNIHELIVREEPHLHEILDPAQVEKFKELTNELRDTWTKKQMFRTKTEMEFSVLNDAKYPTNAAKYWQCVREQNTHMENLMQLSFDGTVWYTTPSMSTARRLVGHGATHTQTSAIAFGGAKPAVANETEEFSGVTSAAEAADISFD